MSRNAFDLEELLRKRADELRGRPQTRWEKFYDRLPYAEEVLGWLAMACGIVAGLLFTFVVWARSFGGAI